MILLCCMQQDELEEYFRVERDQLMAEVTEKEEELVKLREAFDQAHLQQCQKLELERLNIPKEGLSKDDQEQKQSLYYLQSLLFIHFRPCLLFWSSVKFELGILGMSAISALERIPCNSHSD